VPNDFRRHHEQPVNTVGRTAASNVPADAFAFAMDEPEAVCDGAQAFPPHCHHEIGGVDTRRLREALARHPKNIEANR
jgi:hypothetical protein